MQFLTSPGDTVLDPFSGSNMTGAVSQRLGRKWISFEINEEYVESSQMRFEENPKTEIGFGIKTLIKKKKPA